MQTAAPRRPGAGGEDGTAAIIVNPTKFVDLDRARRRIGAVFGQHGWSEPMWLETTVDDPGAGQAREALAAGVDVVCALGGDGTIRAVGAALAGQPVPLALLPAGTGNLLARNLQLPFDSLERCLVVALTGQDAWIDTCRLELVRPTTRQLAARYADDSDPHKNVDLHDAVDSPTAEGARDEHTFLVMAGMGFDAEVMASVPERLKARVGWPAYFVSGLQHLKGPQFTVVVRVDQAAPYRRRVRNVVIGNVGRLQAGMELLPDALVDDGTVDAVLLSPEGIVGWAATLGQILTRRRFGHSRVDHAQGRDVRVVSDKPVEVEVDGDTLGSAIAMRVVVQRDSLLVRVPGRSLDEAYERIDALGDGKGAAVEHDPWHPHHDDKLAHGR